MAIVDKIKGIFNTDDKPVKQDINDPKQQTIVDLVMGDYQYFKPVRQKNEDYWRKEQRFYDGDHWYGLRPAEVSLMRPNSVDNIYWSQIESIVSRLTGFEPAMDFEAQEPGDEQKANLLNEFIPYELRCIKFHPKHTRAVRRMVIHGTLAYMVVHDPSVSGGRGNNRYMGQNDIIPMELGTFFPDPRIRDFINLQDAEANIRFFMHPLSYFRQRFGERGKLVSTSNMASDVEIYDRDGYSQSSFNTSSDGGSTVETSERSGLIEYWYRGAPKMMSKADKDLFKELAEEELMEGKDPALDFAKSKGEVDGIHCMYISTDGVFLEHKSYVYDHGKYPFVLRALFPTENSPWGKGYGRDMISPQVMLNKFSELAVETMSTTGNEATAYEEDAVPKIDVWKRNRSKPGAMLPVSRLDGIKELPGTNVPNSLFSGMEYYKDMLQKIPGQFDSANGQASTNVTSGAQANALINASAGRLSLPSEIIKGALQEVMAQYIELAAQFYKQERVMRITGGQLAFSRDQMVSQAESTYEMEVPDETGAMTAQEVPVIEEYVPEFDIKINIGAEKSQDRDYWVQSALTLIQTLDPLTQMPMIDAKAVQYVLENGRMERMNVIQERLQRDLQVQQQLQELQMQNQQLQEQAMQMEQALGQAQENDMSQQTEQKRMMMDTEKQQFDQRERVAKMDLEYAKIDAQKEKVGAK